MWVARCRRAFLYTDEGNASGSEAPEGDGVLTDGQARRAGAWTGGALMHRVADPSCRTAAACMLRRLPPSLGKAVTFTHARTGFLRDVIKPGKKPLRGGPYVSEARAGQCPTPPIHPQSWRPGWRCRTRFELDKAFRTLGAANLLVRHPKGPLGAPLKPAVDVL